MTQSTNPDNDDKEKFNEEYGTGAKGNPVPPIQSGGVTDKHDKNAGSGAFNEGSAQDPDLDRGVSDQTPDPENVSREKQNPKTPLNDDQV
ncbi:MAG: hypothetical protein ABWZ25_11480 [Chitinophagaceae bacterium]